MAFEATAAVIAAALAAGGADATAAAGSFGTLQVIGTVDRRFLSYNIELVELTGGRFWRPYGSAGTDRYEYRSPVDLANPSFRALAKALAPAYVRFSGTWANATYFADAEQPPAQVPAGFDTVLTRKQWRGAVKFARAVGGEIVTSVATSPGTRDAAGLWQIDTAARWFAYTKSIGGSIAASEFANEPNMLTLTKPPAGYTGADYRRDYATFATWLRKASPKTLLLAPGFADLGEPARSLSFRNKTIEQIAGSELITSQLPRPDGFSFHFYGGGSERCGGKALGHTMEKALTPAWLDAVDPAIARIKALRDEAAPGVPLWNTETGETACGGNPWASAFADTFRFVDTLGRSAEQGVRVVIHNTFDASDYSLIDEKTLAPNPDFWAAVLWKRTMGSTILQPPAPPSSALRIYAACSVQRRGGVALAALNLGETASSIQVPEGAEVWLLEAPTLDSRSATINGRRPEINADGGLTGVAAAAQTNIELPPRSIAFATISAAGNARCRGRM